MNFLKSLVIASAFVSVAAIAAESPALEVPAQQPASVSQEDQKLEEANKPADVSTTTTTTKTKKSKKKSSKKADKKAESELEAESEVAHDETAGN